MPAGVWVLGCVSLLMDISSEMIHSLLPLFLVGTLGISVLALGLIEGLAESTALISKVFSGMLSDYLGRRKGLALLGYGLGALTKPVFALANGVGVVVAARFIDRVGKGMRRLQRELLGFQFFPDFGAHTHQVRTGSSSIALAKSQPSSHLHPIRNSHALPGGIEAKDVAHQYIAAKTARGMDGARPFCRTGQQADQGGPHLTECRLGLVQTHTQISQQDLQGGLTVQLQHQVTLSGGHHAGG